MHAAARAAIQNSRMHAAAAASGARARGGALARGARGDWRAGKTCCLEQMVSIIATHGFYARNRHVA